MTAYRAANLPHASETRTLNKERINKKNGYDGYDLRIFPNDCCTQQGIPGTSQISSLSLTILDTAEVETSSSVPFLSFCGICSFLIPFYGGFLAYNLAGAFLIEDGILGTLRPSNVNPPDEQSFC